MRKLVHKILFLFILAVALGALMLTLSACGQTKQQRLSRECLRIHIRANSNSEGDQQVKLAVRDEITRFLSDALEDCKTKSEALETISANEDQLIQIANSTLYAHEFDYKASILINKEHFPDRNYDGYDFPEGDYDAVIINLGTGEGDNWWCVAFPPLCFVPAGDGEKIVYKSWIKEILDKLF